MSMAGGTWLFDLGNTRLKFAPLQGDAMGAVAAMPHAQLMAEEAHERLPRGAVARVASVAAPAIGDALLRWLSSRFDRVEVARTLPRCGKVRIAYPVPAHLGVDRFLTLLAAHARGGASLIAGVGTALTIDLIDADGLHRGGRIAPSPALMREALQARVEQLPAEGGGYAEFADDTLDALASGCEGAALGLVERSLAQARRLLGRTPRLLLHGGGADVLRVRLPGAEATPMLVLEGLAAWARLDT